MQTEKHSRKFNKRLPGLSAVANVTSQTNKSHSHRSSARSRGIYAALIWLFNAVVTIRFRSRRRRSISFKLKRPMPQLWTRRVDVITDNQHQDHLWHNLDGCTARSKNRANRSNTNGIDGRNQTSTGPTTVPILSVQSPALLKPVSLLTQAQPEMTTITIRKSTPVVSTIASSSTSAPRFTAYRPGSQFTGQFSLSSSSVSPIFQSMALEPSSEGQSIATSMKIQPTVRED